MRGYILIKALNKWELVEQLVNDKRVVSANVVVNNEKVPAKSYDLVLEVDGQYGNLPSFLVQLRYHTDGVDEAILLTVL